ncbi:hypothetical protein GOM49_14215 [Clostridium bovifaecis]|uniref:Flagellar hook-length control protein FliK n=1 Tax=Clostridium bovifaecis TaxID=2184719 RepID=A0A6I6EUT3_9CLOT|nr:hypothetical protein GOM49_14215 [Clostridium bovifaecis]
MPGILNVNSAYDVDAKRVRKKISFELGEKFSARIISLDKIDNEAILKLLDGWQFSAQIRQNMDFTPNKLMKFEVEGYEQGKIILKILEDKEKIKENFILDTLEEQGIKVKKEDYSILEKMIKWNMSLTKENISKTKSLLDFQNRIINNPNEEENFILKYLNNKEISVNSQKGENIQKLLKGFFKEFKGLNIDEFFTMLENNIDLTEENIRSFNKINKAPISIYRGLADIGEVILKNGESQDYLNESNIKIKDKNLLGIKVQKEIEEVDIELSSSKKNLSAQNIYREDVKELSGKEILKKLLDIDAEDAISQNSGKYMDTSNENKRTAEGEISQNKEVQVNGDKEESVNIDRIENNSKLSYKDIESEKTYAEDKLINKNIETSQRVKEELNSKINEMKHIIKQLIEENNNGKSEVFNKILQGLQHNSNDFKVFNSISNQYYYLDVPIKFKDNEYQCKLIVKDDRKKGKKIDSTNVKFVVCVKTMSMGVVDAYIKVLNSNMNVDIKCERDWVKALKLGKEKLSKKLSEIGYSANIEVKEKEKESSLVECRGFFEDNEFTRINFKV